MKRLLLACFSFLGRGLPCELREACLHEMKADFAACLDEAERHRGAPGLLWAGLRGLADLLFGLVRERWVAWRGYAWERARRRPRLTMGEKMMTWIRELRLATRALVRRPGFSGIGMVTLGVGIGATVAIFTLVNAIVIQPLPYPESDRIVELRHHAPALDLPDLNASPGLLGFYADNASAFEALAGVGAGGMNLTGTDRPERIQAVFASPDFFSVFRTDVRQGRVFDETDVVVEGPQRVGLLTDGGLQALFGGAPDVVGRTVELDGATVEIIGVLPASFRPPDDSEAHFVLPLYVDPQGEFGEFGMRGYARLAAGMSLEGAQVQVGQLQQRIPERWPDLTAEGLESFGWSASVRTLKEAVVGDARSTLLIVLGTVSFVLLIACSNVANLFLVRAESRQKELAVRAAMGADRRRIAGSFFSESLVMGVGGGLLGIVIAGVGVEVLTTVGGDDLPRLHEIGITPTVLAFAGLLSLAAGLFLGMIPALGLSGTGSAGILRGNRTSTAGRNRHRARNLLVTTQLALALVLLVGSGLMVRSLVAMNRMDLGFDSGPTLVVGLSVGANLSAEEAARFYQAAIDEAGALPGVVSAGFGGAVPLFSTSSSGGSFSVQGEPEDDETIPEVSLYRAVGPGYMESLGYRLLEGRAMGRADWETPVPALWVNEHFRDAFLDGEALGKWITWIDAPEEPVYAEIVGVFAQTREFRVTDDPMGFALVPMVSTDWVEPDTGSGFLIVRGAPGSDVTSLTPSIRAMLNRLNPNVPITTAQSMEEITRASMADRALTMSLLSIAAAVALFLGMIGLFGVVSYVVGQRTREIGIRMALGAEASDVGGMVLRQGVRVVAVGVGVGLLGSLLASRLLASLLFEVTARDPLTFVVAPLLLVAVSLLATWLPARKAARVDPLTALRAE